MRGERRDLRRIATVERRQGRERGGGIGHRNATRPGKCSTANAQWSLAQRAAASRRAPSRRSRRRGNFGAASAGAQCRVARTIAGPDPRTGNFRRAALTDSGAFRPRRPQAGVEAARAVRGDERRRPRPHRPRVEAQVFRARRNDPRAGDRAPGALLRRSARAPSAANGRGTGAAAALWELSAGRDVSAGRTARAARRHQRLPGDAGHLLPRVSGRGVRRADRLRRPIFQDFCTRRLAHLLDLSRARLQADVRGDARPNSADSRRRSRRAAAPGADRPWPRCGARRNADDDGRTRGSARCRSSMREAQPLGIFTRQDVIARVVLPQRPLDGADARRDERAGGHAAGRRHRGRRGARDGAARHPPRRRRGRHAARSPASCPSATCSACSGCRCASSRRPIRRAADIPTLVQCAADVRALSHALVAQGVAAGQLTRMISSLNDHVAAQHPRARPRRRTTLSGVAVCWLGMGSEGRRRADDRDRPGQRPHLRRQRSGARAGSDPRAAAAVRTRGQRSAGRAAAIRCAKAA